MAGRAYSRGSKSSSTSKGVGERIKSARETGLSGMKSRKKDTATSGTRGIAGGARPRRAGPKGGTQITESVDNLIGGAFTKKGSKGGNAPKTRAELREKRKEALAKRSERVESRKETRGLRQNRSAGKRLEEMREKYGGKGAGTKSSAGPKRVRLSREEAGTEGKRTRPTRPGQKSGSVGQGRKGPRVAGEGSRQVRGISKGGAVGPVVRSTGGNGPGKYGPGRASGQGSKLAGSSNQGKVKTGYTRPGDTVSSGPKRGGGSPKRGNPGSKRSGSSNRNIGQTGGNVGPGGKGPNRTGGGTAFFL